MPKGAILIGWGFTPTDEDVKMATAAGYLKNAGTVAVMHVPETAAMNDELAESTYIHQLRVQRWDFPGNIQVSQLATRNGRKMWSVYPTSSAPVANPLDMAAMEDIVSAAFDKAKSPNMATMDLRLLEEVDEALRRIESENEKKGLKADIISTQKRWWEFWKK